MIEVIIAAFILGFSFFSMIYFLGNLVNKNATNEHKTMATALAEQKMEDLKGQALTADLTGANSDAVGRALDKNGADIGVGGTAGEMYNITWTIVEDSAGPTDLFVVTAQWPSTAGNSQVTIQTLVNN